MYLLDIYLFHLFDNVMPETKENFYSKTKKIFIGKVIFLYLFDSVILETKKKLSERLRFVPIWLNMIPETKKKIIGNFFLKFGGGGGGGEFWQQFGFWISSFILLSGILWIICFLIFMILLGVVGTCNVLESGQVTADSSSLNHPRTSHTEVLLNSQQAPGLLRVSCGSLNRH